MKSATCDTSQLFFLNIFLKILFIYSWETHRQRERERERLAETQAEGEAGSMPGARRGTRSRDSRITPWAKDRCQTAEPPRDLLALISHSEPTFCPLSRVGHYVLHYPIKVKFLWSFLVPKSGRPLPSSPDCCFASYYLYVCSPYNLSLIHIWRLPTTRLRCRSRWSPYH